jgi:hypothetical protein
MEVVPTCDLTAGTVSVNGQTLDECNGTEPHATVGSLRIIGFSSDAISIIGSQFDVFLVNVTVDSESSPLFVQESSVLLIVEGLNLLGSIEGSGGAGIDCSQSNVTVTSVNSGSLEAYGDGESPGIGVVPRGSCGKLSFVNASVSVFGHTGIGTGYVDGGESQIESITLCGA